MDLLVTFVLFIILMLGSLVLNISMIIPLLCGIVMFTILGIKRGFSLKKMLMLIKDGVGESLVVIRILILIGCLTGLWRASGTIAYFVYYGIKTVPSGLFIVATFLLCAIMSYALGTSFGVSATVGVILMTMARAGGVNTVMAAGAVMSGIYFGDRAAPASSCASLVANVTKTNLNENVKLMLKSSAVPFIICLIAYTLMSLPNKMNAGDSAILPLLAQQFKLSVWCIVPVLLLIVPVFMGMKIQYALIINIAVSCLLTVVLQGEGLLQVLKQMIMGYKPDIPELSEILSGGGAVSLLQVLSIVAASCALAGIFRGTGMLSNAEEKLCDLSGRVGRFPAMVVTAFFTAAVFCNQTIGVIMSRQFMEKAYGDDEEERKELMLDLANSVVVIAGIVPWSIACSVPLAMIGGDFRSIPFSIYLYALPICWYFQKRIENNKRMDS